MDTNAYLQEADAFCDALTEAQEDLAREVLSRAAGKWALWVLFELLAAERPLRFSELLRAVEGVTQKALTLTLRQLERDGFITRRVYAEVPPRVEYAMAELGRELLMQLLPLWRWMAGRVGEIERARTRYDEGRR